RRLLGRHDDAYPRSRRAHGRPHRRHVRWPAHRGRDARRIAAAGRRGLCDLGRHVSRAHRQRNRARADRGMTQAGSVAWFAQHETRLAWRDWAWLLSGGRRRRRYAVLLGLVAFVVFTYGFAYLTLASPGSFADTADTRLRAGIG